MARLRSSSEFARDLVKMADQYYNDWKSIIGRSFVSGLFTALGATLGLAIVFGLLGIILDQLGVLPVVGDFFLKIDQALELYRPGS